MWIAKEVRKREELRVGIAGLGAIGKKVAACLDEGIPGLRLVAVSAKNKAKAAEFVAGYRSAVQVVGVGRLPELADIVVECAPAEVFGEIAKPTLRAGRTLVAISVGALVALGDLEDLAQQSGGRIIVPTGALLGLDAVLAAAEGRIFSVRMITRKPPDGLAGAPYLVVNKIDVTSIKEPCKVFEGTARDAVAGFPANVNVAAALGLAGIGPDDTMIEIWADPSINRNMHTIVVEADSAALNMSIANVPSENPKTGKITALSIVAVLRKLGSAIQIGT